jgi:hypothetical protein
MIQFWIVLLSFMISIVTHAKVQIIESTCIQRDRNGCRYEICESKFESYPLPVLMAFPGKRFPLTFETIGSVRLHFHGYSQKADGSPWNADYDPALDSTGKPTEPWTKIFDAYDMERSVCAADPELLVIPISKYRCDTYREVLTEQSKINLFLNDFQSLMGSKIPDGMLTISAHSAGADWISQLIKSPDVRLGKMILYDGLYNIEAVTNLRKLLLKGWIKNLEVVSVKDEPRSRQPSRPYLNSQRIANDLINAGFPKQSSVLQLADGIQYQQLTIGLNGGVQFRHRYPIETPKESNQKPLIDHWTVVKYFWH